MDPCSKLVCYEHKQQLISERMREKGDVQYLACPSGCRFPVIRGIPRFVDSESYTSAFGAQWKRYRRIQLDSFTGTSISKDRLTRLLGGTLHIAGKEVLEAGCGAGRFTEILLGAGAKVFAVDLSSAVEANFDNCAHYHNYFVCQADIVNLPVSPEQFDIVVCIGVIQHTADPEKTISALCSYVKPGGTVVLDHYTYGYPITSARRLLRKLLLKMPPWVSIRFCELLVGALWPVHSILWKRAKGQKYNKIRGWFIRLSPVVDYYGAYPELRPPMLRKWAVLDTHDTLTDAYKHLRSVEEINNQLKLCGMVDIEVCYDGNGVEARARKAVGNDMFPAVVT